MKVDTKPVYCANVQKGWTETETDFNINNERNVQGRNITKECTGTKHYE